MTASKTSSLPPSPDPATVVALPTSMRMRRVTSRLELQRIRLELLRESRRQYGDLHAELLARVPSRRVATGSFEAGVRERLAELAARIRAETTFALGAPKDDGRWATPGRPAGASTMIRAATR